MRNNGSRPEPQDLEQAAEIRRRLRDEIQAGFDQLARGEGRTYDKASLRRFIEDVKARGRAILTSKR